MRIARSAPLAIQFVRWIIRYSAGAPMTSSAMVARARAPHGEKEDDRSGDKDRLLREQARTALAH
jgi:hypothetical protein